MLGKKITGARYVFFVFYDFYESMKILQLKFMYKLYGFKIFFYQKHLANIDRPI